MKKNLQNQLLKSIFFLFTLIIVCAFFVHLLTDSETLSDYAADNPELAYGNSTAHIDESSEESDEEMNPEMNQNHTINDGTGGTTDDTRTDGLGSAADDMRTDGSGSAASNTLTDGSGSASNARTDDSTPADRVIYQEGFYYEPLTDEVKQRITGISYPVSASEATSSAVPVFNMLADNETPAVSYEELRYLSVLYYDFNGEAQTGELICNRGIVEDLVDIFYELYVNEYQIEKIRLIDEYQGDDTASMTDNNTSCFNYRVVDGTASLSKHALGCAIDINPFYNPYIVFNRDGNGEDYISPAGSEIYADRSKDFPYKIDETDLCYKLFTEHGFTWGGNWNSCKDYQHFQKVVE
ncbi:MAG: M15 family metallopeptidase [Blautia sp.]|nr:M15 family metallopeptidase [Lachnoclostridium sp.]MCM1211695.1 M15 family metallopeptidase [Blautia sp.]